MKLSKELASFVYEQIAGTNCGHMANLPNNAVLFSLLATHSKQPDNCYAMSKTEFVAFLKGVVDALEETK